MIHRIFQRHGIAPDELYKKEWRYKSFMYASESIVIDEEEAERKRSKKKGG